MISKRYEVSFYLKDALTDQHRAYMEDLDRFFCERNIFALAVREIKGVSSGNLIEVLRTISNATLGWHKPYERISRYEFTRTREQSCTNLTGMSIRTAIRATKLLESEGLVFCFTSLNGLENHYGINVSRIFELIEGHFMTMEASNSKSTIDYNRWNLLKSSPLIIGLQKFMALFAGKKICDISEVQEIINNAGDVMASLVEGVSKAKDHARKVTENKKTALAELPLIYSDGKPNPKSALALWEREIKDAEHWPSYNVIKTAAVYGMMKNWLNECVANGYGEDEIRKKIHLIIHKWFYVTDANRTMSLVSARHRTYECRMEYVPDFRFYYANRGIIDGILNMTAMPGKTPDNQEREELPVWMR